MRFFKVLFAVLGFVAFSLANTSSTPASCVSGIQMLITNSGGVEQALTLGARSDGKHQAVFASRFYALSDTPKWDQKQATQGFPSFNDSTDNGDSNSFFNNTSSYMSSKNPSDAQIHNTNTTLSVQSAGGSVTTASVLAGGTDAQGQIELNFSGSPTPTGLGDAIFQFSGSYANASNPAIVVLTPSNSFATPGTGQISYYYISSSTTSDFSIEWNVVSTATPFSATYNYVVFH